MVGIDVSSLVGRESMTTYWLMLLVPMLAGLSPWKAKGALPRVQWFLYGLFLIVISGCATKLEGIGATILKIIHGYNQSLFQI